MKQNGQEESLIWLLAHQFWIQTTRSTDFLGSLLSKGLIVLKGGECFNVNHWRTRDNHHSETGRNTRCDCKVPESLTNPRHLEETRISRRSTLKSWREQFNNQQYSLHFVASAFIMFPLEIGADVSKQLQARIPHTTLRSLEGGGEKIYKTQTVWEPT